MTQYVGASVSDREILSIIKELAKAVRCCRQNDIFCENVTLTQFIILDTVSLNQTLNMKKLHDVLSVDKSTLTRLVAPLIRQNLIVRKKAVHDSRSAILELTDKGKNVHEKVWTNLISFIRDIRANIPDEKINDSLEGIIFFLKTLQNVSAQRQKTNRQKLNSGCCPIS